MHICYFGFYNPEYSRNRIFLNALKKTGIKVTEVNLYRERKLLDHRTKGVSLYFLIAKLYFQKRPSDGFDKIIVGYTDYFMVPIAKLLGPLTPIINDFFYSQYNSAVHDRRIVKAGSIQAGILWLIDLISLWLPNKNIVDTDVHGDYYVKEFKVAKEKCLTIYVGTDESVFCPQELIKESKDDIFLVHFHGKYIPLQGVLKIVMAAEQLKDYKDIVFRLIGTGQQYEEARRYADEHQLDNIDFIPCVPYEDLPDYINESDVCLGIFGDSNKSKMVIANKVYEAVACKKPVITQDSIAVRELFTHGETMYLTETKPENIAAAVLELKNTPIFKNRLAEGGYKVFKEKVTTTKIGQQLADYLKNK